MAEGYSEHFTIFADLLGFAEAMAALDDERRLRTLSLLASLASLRGDFDLTANPVENGKSVNIKPAVSTFSDHIVISYPLDQVKAEFGEGTAPFFLLVQSQRLLGVLASQALRLGFLFRGGVIIGQLYHQDGVVFGDAMVEAFRLESQTAIYPRVILSPNITDRAIWKDVKEGILRDRDGLYHLDYFLHMFLGAALPGEAYPEQVRAWLSDITTVITTNLKDLSNRRQLNAFSKWAWFARQFRERLEKLNPEILSAWQVTLDGFPAL